MLLQPLVEQQQQIRGRLLGTPLLVCPRSHLISLASITESSCTFKLTCHSGRDPPPPHPPPPRPNRTQAHTRTQECHVFPEFHTLVV